MASSIGVLMILLGGFVLALSYPDFSNCMAPPVNNNCWSISRSENLYYSGTLGLYVGAIIVILGTVIVAGSDIARLLDRMKGTGADSEH